MKLVNYNLKHYFEIISSIFELITNLKQWGISVG